MVKLKFTTLTPLHISNGEVLDQNFHYKVYNNEVFKIDRNKLAAILAKKEKIDFSQDISTKNIESWISKYQIDIINNSSSYSVQFDNDFKSHLNNPKANGQRGINEFINSNGKFYIPGSSIKGALLTVLNINSLGIEAGENARIQDKFVIRDSEFIEDTNFMVFRTINRPPIISLLCLKPNTTFVIDIHKLGNLSISDLKLGLKNYSITQMKNALEKIIKYKSKTGRSNGADYFAKALEKPNTIKLENDEFLINIGYGGGSWFKVYEGEIPKFPSKSPKPNRKGKEEEAHTTFSVSINNVLHHIGWCKLKIEEE
jgi:CRISPR/Cas system CSM-associated protein Csm5 (group 7 of RAMP superfamily)